MVIMKLRKVMALAGTAVIAAGMMAGCSSQAEETTAATTAAETTAEETTTAAETEAETETEAEAEAETEAAAEGNADLSGSISMSGSTSMETFANALCESFMNLYPNVTVTAEFTGSSAGIESVLSGACDIGNSSRNLSEDEIAAGAVENIVAIDGIAVVTDPANTASGLTREQLSGIYTGEIKNWKDAGGADQAIVVVGREAGSGTRGAFEELLEIEDQCAYANELDSTGAVMAKVAATPGAIGYVSLDVIDDTVKTLSIDEVEPTVENIKGGSYLLSRPFVMATKGEISEQNETVQALFDYLASDEGKALIESVGLIVTE